MNRGSGGFGFRVLGLGFRVLSFGPDSLMASGLLI